MKKLKNGKISFVNDDYFGRPKLNNREYFKEIIGEGGFYRSYFGYNFIEINIYLDIKGDITYLIDKEIIKKRIFKIVKPKECEIEFNNKQLLNKTFNDSTITETGWNVFGNNFRNRIIQ